MKTFEAFAVGLLAVGTSLAAPVGSAHEPASASAPAEHVPSPATLAQLEAVRNATARFLDVDEALKDGYVDIGLFYPNMGFHYLKPELLDDTFDPEEPELLVYADDPCGGKRRLVAVEYAVPVALAEHAPAGFRGNADTWVVNPQFQLWTLHAWLFEHNPAGVFAAHNVRVP